MSWFKKEDTKIRENVELRVERDIFISKVSALEMSLAELRKSNDEVTTVAGKIKAERDKLKTMVREQTEADLLINALKGLGIIPKPPKYDVFAEQQRLMSLQQIAAQQSTPLYQSGSYNGQNPFWARGIF